MLKKDGFTFTDTFTLQGISTPENARQVTEKIKKISNVIKVTFSASNCDLTITSIEPVDAIQLKAILQTCNCTLGSSTEAQKK